MRAAWSADHDLLDVAALLSGRPSRGEELYDNSVCSGIWRLSQAHRHVCAETRLKCVGRFRRESDMLCSSTGGIDGDVDDANGFLHDPIGYLMALYRRHGCVVTP